MKSFAANRTFTSTVIGGRPYTFENLVGIIVKELMTEAEAELGTLGDTVTLAGPCASPAAILRKMKPLAFSA